MSHVEFNACDNNTISSHLIKLRRKIDTVRLCRPDVSTDQDLHCLPLILSDITLNGINKRQKDCIRYYNSNMTANLGLHCSHVTNAAFDVFFFFFFFHELPQIRGYVHLQQISIIRTKDNVGLRAPVATFTPNMDTDL